MRPAFADVFGKIRDIDDARVLAQHFAFLTHRPPPILTGKAIGVAGTLMISETTADVPTLH